MHPVLLAGDPPAAIVGWARRLDAELLVIGARRHAWFALGRARIARRVQAHAPCPVLVLHQPRAPSRPLARQGPLGAARARRLPRQRAGRVRLLLSGRLRVLRDSASTVRRRLMTRGRDSTPPQLHASDDRETLGSVEYLAAPAEAAMTYVIAEPCIGTKDNSCVEVCPVDCIHPTPDEPDYDAVEMLFIDPEECIDCDACVEACPVDAIFAEDQLPEEWASFTERNAEYYSQQK